jgi:PAS domain S-box-containing protein
MECRFESGSPDFFPANLSMTDNGALKSSSLSRPGTGRLAGLLRLRGPLSEEPTARVLNVLLVCILLWMSLCTFVIVPAFAARKPGGMALGAGWALTAAISLYLLRRGSLRKSAIVFVGGTWLISCTLVVLSGGLRSPFLVMYVALPISAAWLLGFRAAWLTAAGCGASALALAFLEAAGLGPYLYFPGRPLVTWTVVCNAILIASVPVATIMKMLQDALAQSKLDQEALRKERDVVSRVMDTSPAGILTVRRDGMIDFANAEGARVLGTTRDEIRLRSYDSAEWRITAHDGQPLPSDLLPFRQVASRREAINGMPIAIQPAGQRILLSVNAAPLVDAAGEFDGMVAAVEDVTERKRVEEELRRHQENLLELVDQRTAELVRALDQAQAAGRAKTAFLANMSHEFRTPLNAILGFSNLMRSDEGIPARQAEAWEIVSRSGSHLLALIDDVLDMARLEAGHAGLEVTAVDLIELVRDVVKLMRISAREKHLELSSVWSGDAFRLIRGDGPKLRQILVNLIGNAIKYTDAGSVTLRMSAEPMDAVGKARLIIEVQDTGIGIASEEQALIFDPFVQLGQANSRKGSGLGLAICRQYAQLMKGTIQVESAPGMGSTLRVELPVEVVKESRADGAFDAVEPMVAAAPDRLRGLAAVANLPEDLKAQLLNAVLLLDQERIREVIRLVSEVEPELGSELRRHAEAFEFTPIMRAIRPMEVA